MNKEEIRDIYDAWYQSNREAIARGEFKPVDKQILEKPETDEMRGLNLISFLAGDINQAIDRKLMPQFEDIVGQSGFYPEADGRHVTILDMIPHNSGIVVEEIREAAGRYARIVDETVRDFKGGMSVELEGVFASPDGITIQGYPNEGLILFRKLLREKLADAGLVNMEQKKYVIETAHVALVKFWGTLDGRRLLETVDKLRDVPLGKFTVTEMILNISPRYDKVRTIEVIKRLAIYLGGGE